MQLKELAQGLELKYQILYDISFGFILIALLNKTFLKPSNPSNNETEPRNRFTKYCILINRHATCTNQST
jgi:hypothetical protein